MTKKKKKESWKEKRRKAAMKHQKALEAERLRREREPKKSKGWPKGKIFGVAFMFLLIIGIYGAWQYTQSSPSGNSNVNGQKAPVFTLTDINGKTVALENLIGKIVILNFFDTHCPPCITEISYLKQIHGQYGSEVVILSMDVDPDYDTVAVLQQFRETNQIDWTIVRDTADIFFQYVSGPPYYTPTTVVINKEGYIYSTHIGWEVNTDPSKLLNEINYLLGS